MNILITNSAILIVLMFLDTVEQIRCQLISKRFYNKILPLLFNHFKVNVDKYIIRRSTDHMKYLIYNMSNSCINIYGNIIPKQFILKSQKGVDSDESNDKMQSNEDMLLCYPIHSLINVSTVPQPKKYFEMSYNPTFYDSTIDYKHVIVNDDEKYRIFIVGGTFNLINAINQCYELIGVNQIKTVKSMIEPRHSFGCVSFKSSIVVIGGYFSHKTVLNSCEFYYVKFNRWVMFPPISEQRALIGTCTFDEYIYCFGGVSHLNKQFYNVIERINMSTVEYDKFDEMKLLFELEWEVIKPKDSEFDVCGYNYGCCQLNTQEILIFGGSIQDKEEVQIRGKLVNRTLIFNTK